MRDITGTPGEGSHPYGLAGLGGSLIFFADDRLAGVELWKTDGTEAGTVLLKDINPGANGSYPEDDFEYADGVLYFTASDDAAGAELWKTDGTEAGTVRVKDINPGPDSSSPSDPTNVHGVLYFAADDGVTGRELWKTDGTEAGTVLVRDIEPALNGSSPASLIYANGVLYFVTNDGAALWKSDGTDAGTMLVRDINPAGHDSVWGLADVQGVLYFSACDDVAGCELWKTDGTEAGTVRVKDIQVGRESGGAYVKKDVDGILYLVADDGVTGTELWKTDGTEEGTVRVKDIYPGTNHSDPMSLRNLNGVLYFTAVDNATGRELWRSDGVESGTVRVKDVRPGAEGSGDVPGRGPWGLTTVNGIVFFSACDDVAGCELWTTDGTEAGTAQVKEIRPGAANSGPSELTNLNDLLFFAADNGTIGEELWILDPTAPWLTVPGGLSAQAQGPGGAAVMYEATARDNFDGPIVPECTPTSGTMFRLGTTTVSCTASDSSGNTATGAFPVTIIDTRPATWTDPGDLIEEATGPTGAVVNYSVMATDTVDPSPIVSCNPPSGSVFSLGPTPVACTARDSLGNEATLSLTVTVRDTTPPRLQLPDEILRRATESSGLVVTFKVTARDVVDLEPLVVCQPASGSSFPVGTTMVSCTATDDAGNAATGLFRVVIQAPEAIVLLGVSFDPLTLAIVTIVSAVVSTGVLGTAVVFRRRRRRRTLVAPPKGESGNEPTAGDLTPGSSSGPRRRP